MTKKPTLSNWTFPDINMFVGVDVDLNNFTTQSLKQQTVGRIDELNSEIEVLKKEIVQLNEQLKSEREANSSLMSQITTLFESINNSVPTIKDSIKDTLMTSFNHIFKKILKSELSENKGLLVKIIDHLVEDLKLTGGFTIELSNDDYGLIAQAGETISYQFIKNDFLKNGEILINSEKGNYLKKIDDYYDTLVDSSHVK